MAPGQQVGFRDADLVQDDVRVLHDPQPDLVRDLGGGVAGPVRLHDEALDLLVRDVAGPDQGEVGDGAGTDPALGPVDDPFAVLQPRRGGQAAGDVRAVVRLGQGEGAELGEGGEAREPAGLLLLRAELVDHADDQLVVDPHQGGERHVGAGHLDVHQPLEELGGAVRLQAAQAVLAQFGEQAEGEFLAVPVVDATRRGSGSAGTPGSPGSAPAPPAGSRSTMYIRSASGKGGAVTPSGAASPLVPFCPPALPCGCTGTYPFVVCRSCTGIGSSKPLDVLVYCTVMWITRQRWISGNGAGPETAAHQTAKGAP